MSFFHVYYLIMSVVVDWSWLNTNNGSVCNCHVRVQRKRINFPLSFTKSHMFSFAETTVFFYGEHGEGNICHCLKLTVKLVKPLWTIVGKFEHKKCTKTSTKLKWICVISSIIDSQMFALFTRTIKR